MNRIVAALTGMLLASSMVMVQAQDNWSEAERNGEQGRKAFLACWNFVHGWLQHADETTGLIPRNLSTNNIWNAKDAAADNYPFMVLSTFYTDKALYEGRMHEMLATEQRVANRVGKLPDDWDLDEQRFSSEDVDMPAIIFGASEYVKDGLLPVTELLGSSPWSVRLVELLDGIWDHAAIESEVGLLPAESHEVSGEMMQSLSRMYWMTKESRYKEWAYRLADYFLLHHSPVEADQLRLDDHGCEIIGGLSEVYYIASIEDPDKHEAWRPPMHQILDRVLEVARDDNGLLVSLLNPKTGEWKTQDRTDNWGYNYNAFLVVAQVDDEPKYRDAVEFALSNLMANKDYPWEADGSDGIADSLEGGLNLVNRLPVPEALEWCNYMGRRLLAKQRDTGVIEGWHGDGNFARTALMYALWKTQGAYLESWRADLQLGAVRDDHGGVLISVAADWPWKGKIRFDVPRHSVYLNMPSDYPRLNQFPEWFTVSAEAVYVDEAGTEYSGETLLKGLEVNVAKGTPWRLRLSEKE